MFNLHRTRASSTAAHSPTVCSRLQGRDPGKKNLYGRYLVRAGEAVITRAGEWVQYSTPGDDGAEYVAVCLPAFSMDTVHRDAE